MPLFYFNNYFTPGYFTPGYFGEDAAAAACGAAITWAQAKQDLARRLHDPTFVRWTAPECGVYLREALRTWNAWTQHWRAQGAITLVMAAPFYDLPASLPALRGQTVSLWDLVRDLQYALLEPPAPGGTWTGTNQFTLAQIVSAIQRRRDQFLRETGAVQTRTVVPFAAWPASGRFPLPPCTLQVRRAAWRTSATQILRPLTRTDSWAADHFAPRWTQGVGSATTSPIGYSTSANPPLTLQILPPPIGAGELDLVTIEAGDDLDPMVNSLLHIPTDLAWVVKYGALADLLSGDGLALDPTRAAYCEQRWQQGILIARDQPVILSARINGSLVRTVALADADAYAPLWQMVSGVPKAVVLAGQTLIGAWPPPGGGGPHTLTLDVVRNAPIPTSDTATLDLPDDVYDTILDLAQHTALFKEGPGQTELALALLERAARAAGVDLMLQQAQQPSRRAMIGQQAQDGFAKPQALPVVGIGG